MSCGIDLVSLGLSQMGGNLSVCFCFVIRDCFTTREPPTLVPSLRSSVSVSVRLKAGIAKL